MIKNIFQNFFNRNETDKTNAYFYNFRNQQSIKGFDILYFTAKDRTLEDVFSRVRGVLKINENTPMQAYAIKDINKLNYTWLYDIKRNGYGPKRNFKIIKKNSAINKWENILINYHHAQNNEDYIIQKIFERIGTSNKYFVEFGAGDGQTISNVALLRYDGWKGLLIEPGKWLNLNVPNAVCSRDFLTPGNIESVFGREAVPKDLDFLSIDTDGNEYYFWQALNNYSPRLLCIEVDDRAKDAEKLKPYEEKLHGSRASIITMTKLSEQKGYKPVYNNGPNVFYVRADDYLKYFKPLKSVKWNEPFAVTVNLF